MRFSFLRYVLGNSQESTSRLDAAVQSVISDDSAWVGLLGYLIADEDEPRLILEESAERLKKELRDDVSLSRVYTILSVAGLGRWREFEEITPDAVMAMRLNHSNAVAYDCRIFMDR